MICNIRIYFFKSAILEIYLNITNLVLELTLEKLKQHFKVIYTMFLVECSAISTTLPHMFSKGYYFQHKKTNQFIMHLKALQLPINHQVLSWKAHVISLFTFQ